MGGHRYDLVSRSARATTDGYFTKSTEEIFKQRTVHDSLSPKGLNKRECFDSDVHPNSLAVILGGDLTGSMGHIPHALIKDGLPTIMSKVIEAGSPDAAICWCGVGDHKTDRGPLQIGQFESGDEQIDRHLENTWLEGGGGGNGGESYGLVWAFAANHTSIHCFEKRGEKGVLITWGDEDIHDHYDSTALTNIFDKFYEGTSAEALLKAAAGKWHVYHLGLPSGHRMDHWKALLGENFIPIQNYKEIPGRISDLVLKHTKGGKRIEPLDTTSGRQDSGNGNNSNEDDDIVFVK